MNQKTTLHEGRHIRLVKEGRWEWAERIKASGIVCIAATTPDDRVLLIEQYRPPVGRRVLELPAGLAGDLDDDPDEAMATAAQRELEEETGYRADHLIEVTRGPISAGMTTEVLTFFVARGLRRVGPGGGDANEDIQVHEVALADLDAFLAQREQQGVMVDPKVFTGLYWLSRHP